jgi:hypothetical protein
MYLNQTGNIHHLSQPNWWYSPCISTKQVIFTMYLNQTGDIHHVSQPNWWYSPCISTKLLSSSISKASVSHRKLQMLHCCTRWGHTPTYQGDPYFPNTMRFHSILEDVSLFIYAPTKIMHISTKYIHFEPRYAATISQFFWVYPVPIFFQIGCRMQVFVLYNLLNKLRFLQDTKFLNGIMCRSFIMNFTAVGQDIWIV